MKVDPVIAFKVGHRDGLGRKNVKDADTPMKGGAYGEGYEAAQQGGTVEDNPYPEGHSTAMETAHGYWEIGFFHCKIDLAKARRRRSVLPAEISDLYDLLMTNDQETWRRNIASMVEKYRDDPEKGLSRLGRDICHSFPRMLLEPFSVERIIIWRDIWVEFADANPYPELQLSILVLDIFAQYQQNPDVRLILTELPPALRPFLTQLLDRED